MVSVRHEIDRSGLAHALKGEIRGEVRFDAGDRALYDTDSSNYRHLPIGVLLPRDAEDVVAAVAVCRRFGAPVLPRGAGTSLAGQTCGPAVVIDTSRYMGHILEVDPVRKTASVQPGVVLDDLRAAAEVHGLTFGPDPATHNRCTLGGMIGNNACGVHSITAGMTDDNVVSLDILTYDGLRLRVGRTSDAERERLVGAGGRTGQIYGEMYDLAARYAPLIRERFPQIPRRVSGYNLPALLPEAGFDLGRALVGSEGTCAMVLHAEVRLVESPPHRVLVVLAYDDIVSACDEVPEIMRYGPIGLEGFDDLLANDARSKNLNPGGLAVLPDGGGWLLAEFGGNTLREAEAQARSLMQGLGRQHPAPRMRLLTDPHDQHAAWAVRESALGATAIVPGRAPAWPGWEDAAVPPERVGAYLRDFRALVHRYGYISSLYGHFGQGCVHTRTDFDFSSPDGIARFRSFIEECTGLVLSYGGSLSGEHGDGQARGELLPRMFGEELMDAFRQFKAIWDPDGMMNPGVLIDARPLDADLRLAVPPTAPPHTHFAFRRDGGNFASATIRCVGVGRCRRHDAGTMCPSYMVTREEMHSTRGRARLLHEMLRGDPLTDGWRDESVREALDLCLACKGCKHECPTQVDMATYKAEFLAHYYEGRLRPRSAYAMGLIDRWARLAAHIPSVVNAVARVAPLRRLLFAAAGVDPRRELPTFAGETFTGWWKRRGAGAPGGTRILLWPDTFTQYFNPEIGRAAVQVLEAAGYSVELPPTVRCCGRPLYDFGFLDRARSYLLQILTDLSDEIDAGTPVVVLEPSCLAVFRDEMVDLLPDDVRAQRLAKQTVSLSEALQTAGYIPPGRPGRAIVHGHCHQKAVVGMGPEMSLLSLAGLDAQLLDSGCCGMAGAFGFERGHYDVSVACAERVLLPAVSSAGEDILLIADGFSCREQIRQLSGRRAIHLAEALVPERISVVRS